jgi:L-fuconolactonase
VYCKISGLVTEADWASWSKEDIIPFMDVLLSVFGAKRLMFGSDWPVCLLAAAEYNQVWLPVKQYLSALSVEEQAQIFHGTATEFYRLTL